MSNPQFRVPVSPLTLADGTIYSLRGIVPDQYLTAVAPPPDIVSDRTQYGQIQANSYHISAEYAFNLGYGSYFNLQSQGDVWYYCWDLIAILPPVSINMPSSPIVNQYYAVGGRLLIMAVNAQAEADFDLNAISASVELSGGCAQFAFESLGLGPSAFPVSLGLIQATLGGLDDAAQHGIGMFQEYVAQQIATGDPTQWTPALVAVDLDMTQTTYNATGAAQIGVYALQAIKNGQTLQNTLQKWQNEPWHPSWQQSLYPTIITGVYGDFGLGSNDTPSQGSQQMVTSLLNV